eukprot:TRINITY_DN10560_c0_g1_i6.p1 TRINITY_DN10560_c0_g1~~TRINITY_DN10560_c0_g1_i6.p1  ORF type:complete len:599 (+),score=146.86 TRINITY_DN10560_c0_g1_i6:91-1887(+)
MAELSAAVLAKKVLDEGGPIRDRQVLEVLDAYWPALEPKGKASKVPTLSSMTPFGLITNRGGKAAHIAGRTASGMDVVRLLSKWLLQSVPSAHFTSIALLPAAMEEGPQGQTEGASYIRALGSDVCMRSWEDSEEPKERNIAQSFVVFSAARRYTLPLCDSAGKRCIVMWYTSTAWRSASTSAISQLKQIGFPYPESEAEVGRGMEEIGSSIPPTLPVVKSLVTSADDSQRSDAALPPQRQSQAAATQQMVAQSLSIAQPLPAEQPPLAAQAHLVRFAGFRRKALNGMYERTTTFSGYVGSVPTWWSSQHFAYYCSIKDKIQIAESTGFKSIRQGASVGLAQCIKPGNKLNLGRQKWLEYDAAANEWSEVDVIIFSGEKASKRRRISEEAPVAAASSGASAQHTAVLSSAKPAAEDAAAAAAIHSSPALLAPPAAPKEEVPAAAASRASSSAAPPWQEVPSAAASRASSSAAPPWQEVPAAAASRASSSAAPPWQEVPAAAASRASSSAAPPWQDASAELSRPSSAPGYASSACAWSAAVYQLPGQEAAASAVAASSSSQGMSATAAWLHQPPAQDVAPAVSAGIYAQTAAQQDRRVR